jgi:GNAT superfamily N-acetyltransferase
MPTGYKIRGIEPPDLASYPPPVRKQFWQWVVDAGLKRKDKELSEGLNKDGKPLRGISKETRKHRRSAMTPSGKGDPKAPPLIPGWQKSRTRSLLAGKAHATYAEFYWRYDAYTGASWSEVLTYQAEKGRDVFGLSDRGTAWVEAQALRKWEAWKSTSSEVAGTPRAPSASSRHQQAPDIGQVGRKPTPAATYGIGTDEPLKGHGGRTQAEWDKFFRGTAPASIPGRPRNPAVKSRISGAKYNRLLGYTWGQGPGHSPRQGSAAPRQTGPGPRKPAPLPKFGPTEATIRTESGRNETLAKARELFGRPVSLRDLASFSGATKSATVTISVDDYYTGPKLFLHVQDDKYNATRAIVRDAAGKLYLKANTFFVAPEHQGKGIAREVFGRMVETGVRLGLDRFETFAMRDTQSNGYYTWPLFGYDGPITRSVKDRLPQSLRSSVKMSDLFATQEGIEWWQTNGESIELTFNLAEGSLSRLRWAAYRRDKMAVAASKTARSTTKTSR